MLKVQQISGFKAISPRGRIENEKGLFYVWDKPGVEFNIPPGIYEVFGLMKRNKKRKYVNKPTKTPRHVTDVIERHGGAWALVQRGTLFRPGKIPIILMPQESLFWPTPVSEFVYRHELAHCAGIVSETKADRYAALSMLGAGFNPSQVFWACSILKDLTPKRVEILRNWIRKNYNE